MQAQSYGPDAFRQQLEIGESGAGGSYTFHDIRGLGMDDWGRIWTADLFNALIRIFSTEGRLIRG